MTRAALEAVDPLDLPTIDLGAPSAGATSMMPLDRRTYEERFAELGFGLGTVPRKIRRDDAWWETPAGMLVVIGALLFLLWVSTSAH